MANPRAAADRVPVGPSGTGREGGHTLVELIVAMSLFTTVLAVIVGVVVQLTADVRKNENLSAAADGARKAFARLDLQVRYASAINRPGTTGNDWYVEFQAIDATNTLVCRQWRLVNSTHQLQQRSWDASVTPATPPTWQTVATSVVNDPATQPPFAFSAASASVPTQQLTVDLVVTQGRSSSATVNLSTTFAARNTDTTTSTNPTGSALICQNGVGRP